MWPTKMQLAVPRGSVISEKWELSSHSKIRLGTQFPTVPIHKLTTDPTAHTKLVCNFVVIRQGTAEIRCLEI